MKQKKIKNVLTIAGSDPSGGAGIQADLKSFSANGVYGMSVITALTAQNTKGVSSIHSLPKDFILDQLNSIFNDIQVDAVKIGMIANSLISETIANFLHIKNAVNIVLDPVMVAKGGAKLLEDDAISSIKSNLMPISTIVTPNLPEASILSETKEASSQDEMTIQGKALLNYGANSIFIKGGHLKGIFSPDLLVLKKDLLWFNSKKIKTKNTHGTGCTLSSAIAANLSKGFDISKAVKDAKDYVYGAIKYADNLDVGSGNGPTHHFHSVWQNKLVIRG